MNLIVISGIQLMFLIPGILAFSSLIYILFFNKEKSNLHIEIIPQIFLYFFTLVPLGLFIGLYIESKKKKVNGNKVYKYSFKSRQNASLIIIISSISLLLSIYNLSKN